MRRPSVLSVLAVFPLLLAASIGGFAFQRQGGAAGVVAFVNESAARALTRPKMVERQSICEGGCRKQRPITPVRRDSGLSAQARQLLDAANKYYDTGNYADAAENFRKAARLKPNYEAFLGLGESQYQLGQPDEAIRSYQQAVKLNPKLDDARYNMGVILYEKKSYAEALESLKAAVQITPENADEYYYYGLTLVELKRDEEAIRALRDAIRIDSRYYNAYMALGSVYDRSGRRREAAEVLRQAVQVRPDRGEAHLSLGDVLFNDRKLDEAVAAYGEAARLMPTSASAYNNLGDSYYSLVRSPDAVANYQKALSLDPALKKDWGFSVRYGNSLRLVGSVSEGVQWLNNALTLNPKDDTPLYLIGVAHVNRAQPDYPAAIEVLERAAMLNRDRKETFLLLTIAYANSVPRRPAEALRAARRAQQLAPNDPEVLLHVGLALVVGQMFEPAYDVFKEVLRLKPDHPVGLAQICNVSIALERYEGGVQQCTRAVELSSPEARNMARVTLANMYAFTKRYDSAIAEASAVLREDPKLVFAHLSLGMTYFLMKKWDKSFAAFKEAIRLSPELAEPHLQLGVAYAESGNTVEATREYTILLSSNPGYAAQLKALIDEQQDKKKKKN